MREGLKTDSDKMLVERENLVTQIKELSTSFQPEVLKLTIEADVKFVPSTDIADFCSSYGEILAPAMLLVDPSKCYVVGEGIEMAATVEKQSTIHLKAIDFRGELCKETIQSIECELVSDLTGKRGEMIVQRSEGSQYKISYSPTTKGQHHLSIKIEGQHIKGSPFPVAATSPIEEIGFPIHTIGNINTPIDIAINQQGHLVVTEWGKHCVSILKTNGERILSLGGKGATVGKFKYPHGIAVDSAGNIFVADNSSHQIQKFSPEGKFLTASNNDSNSDSWLVSRGIAVNPSNNKIYASFNSNCIQILNSDLTYLSSFGREGAGDGDFDDLGGLACDSSGKVYVVDSGNHRIQVFTADGQFLKIIGSHWRQMNLNWPKFVAVDLENRVYVSDSGSCCVSVFTSEGQFVTAFGKEGMEPGEFSNPYGLAVDSCGVLYVCDVKNKTIQVF